MSKRIALCTVKDGQVFSWFDQGKFGSIRDAMLKAKDMALVSLGFSQQETHVGVCLVSETFESEPRLLDCFPIALKAQA